MLRCTVTVPAIVFRSSQQSPSHPFRIRTIRSLSHLILSPSMYFQCMSYFVLFLPNRSTSAIREQTTNLSRGHDFCKIVVRDSPLPLGEKHYYHSNSTHLSLALLSYLQWRHSSFFVLTSRYRRYHESSRISRNATNFGRIQYKLLPSKYKQKSNIA